MPLVLDADALNAFAGDPDRLVGREGATSSSRRIPGEMARLVGMSIERGAGEPPRASRATSPPRIACYVVLKGHRTLIATPDGQVVHQPDRQPGMATGGTGDVLTGMIAAWLGAAARRRGRVQAGGLPARHGRRSRRGRRRGGGDDAGDVAAHLGDAHARADRAAPVVKRESQS